MDKDFSPHSALSAGISRGKGTSRETRAVGEFAGSTATVVLLKPTFNSNFAQHRRKIPGTVLICEFLTLGGPSLSSATQFVVDSGLQPLKLQGVKTPDQMELFVGTKVPTSCRMAGCQLFSNSDSTKYHIQYWPWLWYYKMVWAHRARSLSRCRRNFLRRRNEPVGPASPRLSEPDCNSLRRRELMLACANSEARFASRRL